MLNSLRRWIKWLRKPPLNEPKGLFQVFKIGVCLILIGSVSTVSVGIWQGLWNFSGVPAFKGYSRCQEQQAGRQEREQELNKRLKSSDDRLSALNTSLIDPNPAYIGARTAISIEEALKLDIERDKKALEVQTVKQFLFKFVISLIATVLFSLVAARLAGHQGLGALKAWNPGGESENWARPYLIWVAIIFSAHTAREIFTSIIQTRNKSWFAWSSFCVSSEAWTLMMIVTLGVAMVVAYPATILWHFGRETVRPVTLDPTHKDGQWGVGSYVLFIHTWAILTLVFLVFPLALWLRTLLGDPRFSTAYLLPSSVLLAAGLVISGRMIANAIAIRRAYHAELEKLGTTWQEIEATKPPSDPTINFLGEHWWKLPTIIVSMFAFLWLIPELIGVSDFLRELTGVR